jgi:hypothetical protein
MRNGNTQIRISGDRSSIMAADFDAGSGKPALLDSSSAIILSTCGLIVHVLNYYMIIMLGTVFSEITREQYAWSDDFRRFRKEKNIYVKDDIQSSSNWLDVPAISGLVAGEQDIIFYKSIIAL